MSASTPAAVAKSSQGRRIAAITVVKSRRRGWSLSRLAVAAATRVAATSQIPRSIRDTGCKKIHRVFDPRNPREPDLEESGFH